MQVSLIDGPSLALCELLPRADQNVIATSLIFFSHQIKEKSERSLGMNVRSSVDYGQDDYGRRSSGMGRNSLTPGSQPGSRPGSRAPSHHGSNVSLNSEDDGRRGSGVRRTSSMRSGSRNLRPTPMGFGSQVPRKTSTPGDRKRTDSNSSTDRTPLSAR